MPPARPKLSLVPPFVDSQERPWWGSQTPPIGNAAAPHVFDTAAWLGAWERATPEHRLHHRYLCYDEPDGSVAAAPFYVVAESPMWDSYEADAGVASVWPGPVLSTPSLYSFYGANTAPVERARTIIDAGLQQARLSGAEALVVGNLVPEVAAMWAEVRPPTIAMVLDRTYCADVTDGVEEHLASLDGHARREFRRQWRRSKQRGVTLVVLEGEAMQPRLAEFHALADSTSRRHGPSLYSVDTFVALSQVPGATLLLAEHEREVVGAFLTFLHGQSLYLWAGGYDYERRAELGTYSFLLYESISFAVDRGCRFVEAGRGNFQFKERHGFIPTDLWSLLYVMPGPGHRELVSRLRDMDTKLRAHLSLPPQLFPE
jgi:hypothetical protein